jgi:Domain of unknown function (DUF1508)
MPVLSDATRRDVWPLPGGRRGVASASVINRASAINGIESVRKNAAGATFADQSEA